MIDGVTSRTLGDRALRRRIEDAWSAETRSPSKMMQELSGRLREAGLHVFRHRRGMLFVSPIRLRAFAHEETGVSPQVKAILETIAAVAQINRKELAEKILIDLAAEEAEARKLALASDLHWLIGEGYVIEFNDGSLDLPRVKAKTVEAAVSTADDGSTAKNENKLGTIDPIARGRFGEPPLPQEDERDARATATNEEAEIGGS